MRQMEAQGIDYENLSPEEMAQRMMEGMSNNQNPQDKSWGEDSQSYHWSPFHSFRINDVAIGFLLYSTSFGFEYSKKSLKIAHDEKFVKVCLLMHISLQFDNF